MDINEIVKNLEQLKADIKSEIGSKAYNEDLKGQIEKLAALDSAIDILSVKPCTDAISRQGLLDTFGITDKSTKYGGDHSGYDVIHMYEVKDVIEDAPPVQAKTVANDDCISRKEMLIHIDKVVNSGLGKAKGLEHLKNVVEYKMQPVQSEIEFNEDYISRQAVIDRLDNLEENGTQCTLLKQFIKALPPVWERPD